MERCKTCKHWTTLSPENDYGVLLGSGECDKTPQIWDVTEDAPGDNWNGTQQLRPEHAAVLAAVADGSSYRATLVTMPDFGCVQHEPAERPET